MSKKRPARANNLGNVIAFPSEPSRRHLEDLRDAANCADVVDAKGNRPNNVIEFPVEVSAPAVFANRLEAALRAWHRAAAETQTLAARLESQRLLSRKE
jgi:hypothetical protein